MTHAELKKKAAQSNFELGVFNLGYISMTKYEMSVFSESSVVMSGHYAWKFNRLNRLVASTEKRFQFPLLTILTEKLLCYFGGK